MNVSTAAFGGKRAPRQVLLDALNHAEQFKCCVLVYLDDEDYINTAWSDGSMLQRLGMLDIAKLRMIDAAQDEDAGQ